MMDMDTIPHLERKSMMPITMSDVGEKQVIKRITGKDEIRRRLASMGFVVNGDATVVSKIAGNMIIQIKDSRIALDKSMASRIIV